MSSTSRPRSSSSTAAHYDGVVRRLVGLPRTLLGGLSRAAGLTASRPPHHFPPPPPPPMHYHPPPPPDDQWGFLSAFESFYGHTHPFFYACSFNDALKLAREEGKLMFMYLHYPDPSNPFTVSFCRDTLCSELAVEYVDGNFVSWGGLADRGEGAQMARLLRPSTFPFCAVIAPATNDNVTVLQQIEGPVSPSELVEILQRTMEDQGVAFGSSRAREEERRRADRRLREEQDAAYFAALKIDQERERAKNRPKSAEKPTANAAGKPFSVISSQRPIKGSRVKEASTRETQHRSSSIKGKPTSPAQILVKFPNGERLEHGFSSSDKVQAIFEYIDSLGLAGVGNYRLVASFPRKVYGADQMSLSLKDAGLYPKATLFLEPL